MANLTEVKSNSSFDPFQSNTEQVADSDILLGCPLLRKSILLNFSSPFGECKWHPINHIFFQCAYILLFISYCSPNTIRGILFLRISALICNIVFCLWGILVSCYIDVIVWNAAFVFINLCHIVAIFYTIRPVILPPSIHKIYDQLFCSLNVTKQQFEKILKCKWQIKDFPADSNYAVENVSKVEALGLVLQGRFRVTKCSKLVHYVEPGQFIDSPEWIRMTSGELFVVSIKAVEDSRVLMWNRDKLKLKLINDIFLQTVFNHIVSKDAADKYFDSESFAQLRCMDQKIKKTAAIPNLNDENDSSHLLHKQTSQVPPYYTNTLINYDGDGNDRPRTMDYETTL